MHVCCIYIRVDIQDAGEFAHRKIRYELLPLGISYISSCLKNAGYTTELMYCTPYIYNKGFTKFIEKEPQVFAISITGDNDYKLAVKIIDVLKKEYKNSKIIIGGPIVTINAEEIVDKLKNIDAMCLGAGEKAIVEYVSQVEKGEYKKTDNLWIKTERDVIRCDRVLSIENLDELPYPDRLGWKKWVYFTKIQQVLVARGCIYNCVFCANGALRNSSYNKLFRERNLQEIIKEIDYLVKEFKDVEEIKLISENMLANTEQFRKLCLALKEYNNKLDKKLSFNIKLNFTSNLLNKDKDIIYLMKDAGFKWLRFSLESGSFEIRKKLKKPPFTNEQIIEFFRVLNQLDFITLCYVMYCYPFETKETYLQTIDCLKKCKPTYIGKQILHSIKHTELEKILNKQKYKKINFVDKFRFYTLSWRAYLSYKPITDIVYMQISKFKIVREIQKMFLRLKYNKNSKFERYQKQAKEEFDKKNYKEAIKLFNKIKIREDNYWIYGDRAIAKMCIGDYIGAIKDFDKMLQLDYREIFKQKRKECLALLNNKFTKK